VRNHHIIPESHRFVRGNLFDVQTRRRPAYPTQV
jgi:hypothetical protein